MFEWWSVVEILCQSMQTASVRSHYEYSQGDDRRNMGSSVSLLLHLLVFFTILKKLFNAYSTLTLSVWRQEKQPAFKNMSGGILA